MVTLMIRPTVCLVQRPPHFDFTRENKIENRHCELSPNMIYCTWIISIRGYRVNGPAVLLGNAQAPELDSTLHLNLVELRDRRELGLKIRYFRYNFRT